MFPLILGRLAALWRRLRARPDLPPLRCPMADQGEAIAVLERDRLITTAEAHALCAGERLAELYAELAVDEAGVSLPLLEDAEAAIRARDLREAGILIGRLHPALRDLPHLIDRSLARGRP